MTDATTHICPLCHAVFNFEVSYLKGRLKAYEKMLKDTMDFPNRQTKFENEITQIKKQIAELENNHE